MTDGPFRNAKLSKRWKRYGQSLVSDAETPAARALLACDCMLEDVNMDVVGSILADLTAYAQRAQLDLDPGTAVEAIFEGHPPSDMTDAFRRQLMANLMDGVPADLALSQAISTVVKNLIDTTKSRLASECMHARTRGDMSVDDYRRGISRNNETFSAINQDEICAALVSGNKRAFKQSREKKSGVDDGPE